MIPRDATAIALEHALYAVQDDQSPGFVLAALGVRWLGAKAPTWEDVVYWLSVEARRMVQSDAAAA